MHDVLPFEADFLVHVLAVDQAALSERFAIPDLSGPEQFEGVDFSRHSSGLSMISGAALVLYCRLHNVFPAGDHSLVIGLVAATVEVADRLPLVYYDQGYREVGPSAATASKSSAN
jgi:flavin reductase (DIM6/NTAB) family NADH-FMN oxidoreductase RutF